MEDNLSELIKTIAYEILNSLSIAGNIRNIDIEEVESPWDEKVIRIKKNQYSNIKLILWKNNKFLYGRIYRLFLYISDAFNKDFQYNHDLVPHGTAESKIRETYNHIWGIYVDSRLERKGIENFFDKTLRKNLFIDSQKNLSWTVSNVFFDKLWSKDVFTHPKIIDYAYNLDQLADHDHSIDHDAFEIEISKTLMDHTAMKHIDHIASRHLRDIAYDILNFAASHCKGAFIESSYYGIYFMYDQEIFAEMATTKTDALLITLFDFQSNHRHTYTVTDQSSNDLDKILSAIKTIYERIASHSTLKIIKNSYAEPIEE
jgi:hypothetical protein